ncbi:hypothetical protein PR202_gb11397 [Eleusine coracana subsp. coracana]|uniref:Peroxidase n=1 Tax=Eleusine coracana subsp. coracana TaxID=191504 RepID=A0AAV5EKH0_ELECO|nr:hypothetical protein QOZ80_3BG0266580 [Eleusine coracana subsp. coracana]GJN23724.1 hypothetical protein PR202_gb11397 [Eleusine coracana subsp. coracana]
MAAAMARSSTAAALVAILMVSLLLSPALSASSALLPPALSVPLNATVGANLSDYFTVASCPNLEQAIFLAMFQVLRSDISIAAGLLRLYFHDCFPQGCDASILLQGRGSEQQMGNNLTLHPKALQLIEQLRAQAAVKWLGGPDYAVAQGMLDSVGPASAQEVGSLPAQTSDVPKLLSTFASKGFGDPTELVAFSGAHTIGVARCDSFRDRALKREDVFATLLLIACARNPGLMQPLDVMTWNLFDNKYLWDLKNRQGVLTSDMALIKDARTAPIVDLFAQDQNAIFAAFAKTMTKLSHFRPHGNSGEIRRNCFRANGRRMEEEADEGLAASA